MRQAKQSKPPAATDKDARRAARIRAAHAAAEAYDRTFVAPTSWFNGFTPEELDQLVGDLGVEAYAAIGPFRDPSRTASTRNTVTVELRLDLAHELLAYVEASGDGPSTEGWGAIEVALKNGLSAYHGQEDAS